MSERENITDILCVGCQKGSTSWLHSVLNCHRLTTEFPDNDPITSTVKEAHFWDRNRDRGLDWYRDLMTPDDPAKITLDFTPEYAYMSAEQIAECKSLNPSAQVIYILRDPLARAVSAIRMLMLWRFGKDYDAPLAKGDLFFEFMRNAGLQLHGDYLRHVTAWRAQYPNLILLNYEDFHTDREASVQNLFDRLGLDVADLDPNKRTRFNNLCKGGRVWVSEKFPIERPALQYLNGLTWRFRKDAETQLGMTFTEAQKSFDL